jgi:hypothetical protein
MSKPVIDWGKLRQRHLMLASPLYGNMLHFGYHQSILNLALSCQRSGIAMGVKYVGCDSLVPRARNRLVAHFLDSKSTDLLFVDSDITFSSEDVFTILSSDEPIIGGVYPRKQLDWNRISQAAKAGVSPDQLPYYGFIPVMNWSVPGDYSLEELIEVRHLGTGFLRIKREVFTTMISKLGDSITFDYSADEPLFQNRTGYDFFTTGPDVRYPLGSGGRQYLSEDWGFSELARQCGFKLYAAPLVRLVHSGYMDYMGSIEVFDQATEEALSAATPST